MDKSVDVSEERIDPIGAELAIEMLAAGVSIVTLLHRFGMFVPRHKRVLASFKRLEDEAMRLHHCLDDVVLTIHRHVHSLPEEALERSISERPPTLSATLMSLRRHDYTRWRDTQDKLHNIQQEIYRQATEIRSALREADEDEFVSELDSEVLKPFDDLLAGFGTRSFGDVISGLREAVISLEETLEWVIGSQRKR